MPVTSPLASGDALAGEVQHTIPRVLSEAICTAPPDGTRGYHPAIGVSLAALHRWATYKSFASVLHDLMFIRHLSDACPLLARLSNNHVPFAANRRFPVGELYVCIDRAPVSFMILRMNQGISEGPNKYFDAVRDAHEMMMKGDVGPSFPVVYDQRVFESVFKLQWY